MKGPGKNEQMMLELERIRERSGSDFVAYAMPAEHYRLMRWNFVIGSRNGRVGQMKLKPGIGIGGMVLRHGVPYTINDRENPLLLGECPVMLAEKLASAIAFPVPAESLCSLNGILLLGRRSDQRYDVHEVQGLHTFLHMLVESE
ncbi:conserved hypothetical protein [Paenibacillus curdlanolyticus YK9]|uniref:GAF domain-containing protein n=1 Tax=Paenibacillus curdlanolyticus YK9 TaxID=717606 RepID=E0I5G8_9BACL|nr:GAF domain-containing protein [Paenibacillus curdlanolyticus]EFM12210.1 conserved hypothetical protein [Paenibacillus curdlanolyticus YK9]